MNTTFNTYMASEGLDTIRRLCLQKGTPLRLPPKAWFCQTGEVYPYIAYVKEGLLRHTCPHPRNGRNCSVGFAFEKELVADYPSCLYAQPSETGIQAITECTLLLLPTEELLRFITQEKNGDRLARRWTEGLFVQVYRRLLDTYRKSIEERYCELMSRCPRLTETLTLKEIASYLNVTPETISHIRRRLQTEEPYHKPHEGSGTA